MAEVLLELAIGVLPRPEAEQQRQDVDHEQYEAQDLHDRLKEVQSLLDFVPVSWRSVLNDADCEHVEVRDEFEEEHDNVVDV